MQNFYIIACCKSDLDFSFDDNLDFKLINYLDSFPLKSNKFISYTK